MRKEAPEAVVLEMQAAIYRLKDEWEGKKKSLERAKEIAKEAQQSIDYHELRMREIAEFLNVECDAAGKKNDYVEAVKSWIGVRKP